MLNIFAERAKPYHMPYLFYNNSYKIPLTEKKIKSQNPTINATIFPTLATLFLKLWRWVLTHQTGVTYSREGSSTARTQARGAAQARRPAAAVSCTGGRGMPVGCPRAIRTKKAPCAGHALTPLPSGRISSRLLRAARPEPGPGWPLSAIGLLNAGGLRAARPVQVFPWIPITAAVPSSQMLAQESGQQPSSRHSDLSAPRRTVPTRPPHASPGPAALRAPGGGAAASAAARLPPTGLVTAPLGLPRVPMGLPFCSSRATFPGGGPLTSGLPLPLSGLSRRQGLSLLRSMLGDAAPAGRSQ